MKIAGIEIADDTPSDRRAVTVLVHGEGGVTGVGEIVSDSPAERLNAALAEAARHLVGSDPFDVHAIGGALGCRSDKHADAVLRRLASGLEAACLDLVGKRLAIPVCQIFGGPVRSKIRLCATCSDDFNGDAAAYAMRAKEISESGFSAMKFDPFGAGDPFVNGKVLARAVDIVRTVRETVGSAVDLIVDANARLKPGEVVRVSRALEPFGLMWVEDPVPAVDPRLLAKLPSTLAVPVAVGERVTATESFRELIEQQLTDVVQPDCHNVGGIHRTRAIALFAESYYMDIALHHSGGPVSLAMNLHIAAVSPNCVLVEVPYPCSWWNSVREARWDIGNGFLAVPEGPGLGMPAEVAYRRRSVNQAAAATEGTNSSDH